MKKFVIDGEYRKLLEQSGIDAAQVLQIAQLPQNTFEHQRIQLKEKQYYQLMNAIDEVTGFNKKLLIQLATQNEIETFSPAIYAAFCSSDGLECLKRLAKYKKLIGSVCYQIQQNAVQVKIKLNSITGQPIDSAFFIEGEFCFLKGLISKALGQEIKPIKVITQFDEQSSLIEDFLGIKFEQGSVNEIIFALNDMQKQFQTANRLMVSYLKPELNKRLGEFDTDESYSAQVRNVITELLPTGQVSAEMVAQKLNLSKRTLQRFLKKENTNFQQQLNNTREILAKNYMKNMQYTTDEIAYLLGYQETNSFLRAFAVWTGKTVSEYRKNMVLNADTMESYVDSAEYKDTRTFTDFDSLNK